MYGLKVWLYFDRNISVGARNMALGGFSLYGMYEKEVNVSFFLFLHTMEVILTCHHTI